MHTLTKQAMRREALKRRAALNADERLALSGCITARTLRYVAEHGVHTVFLYASTREEVDTTQLLTELLQRGCTVCLPKCYDGGVMEAYAVTDIRELQSGRFGILEPTAERLASPESIDIAFVPGCLFGKNGGRLGYGGGYYDRFLPRCTSALYIGLSYSACVTETVPCEPFDVRMHSLITENGVMNIL